MAKKTSYDYLMESEENISIIPYVDQYISNFYYSEDVDEKVRDRINKVYQKIIKKMYNIPENIMSLFVSEANRILQQNGIQINSDELYEIIQDYISEHVIQKQFYKEIYNIISQSLDEKTISEHLLSFLLDYDNNIKNKILYHIKNYNFVNYIDDKKLQVSLDTIIKRDEDDEDSQTYKIELTNYIYNEAADYVSDISNDEIEVLQQDIEILLEQDLDLNKSYLTNKVYAISQENIDKKIINTLNNLISNMIETIRTKINVLEKVKSFILDKNINAFYDLSKFYRNYFMKDLEIITKIRSKNYYEKTKEGTASISDLIDSIKSDFIPTSFIGQNNIVCKEQQLYLLHYPIFYSILKAFQLEKDKKLSELLTSVYTEFDNFDLMFIIHALQKISFNSYEKKYALLKNLEELREEYKTYTDKTVSYSTVSVIDNAIFLYKSVLEMFIVFFDNVLENYQKNKKIDKLYFLITLTRFVTISLDFLYFSFSSKDNFYEFISNIMKIISIPQRDKQKITKIPDEYFYRILESKKGKSKIDVYYLDLPFMQVIAYRIKYYLLNHARKSLYYIYGNNLKHVLENEKVNVPKYGYNFYKGDCDDFKEYLYRTLSLYAYLNKKFNTSIYNLGLKKFWRYFIQAYLVRFYQNERVKKDSIYTTKENIYTYDKEEYLKNKSYLIILDDIYEYEIIID